MSGTFLCMPVLRAVDATGAPLPGALLQFYVTGTTTPTNVYSSSTLETASSNPAVADFGGLFVPIWLDPAVTYRVQLQTSAGSVIRDIDPVAAPMTLANASVTAAMLQSGVAVANVGYTPLNKAGDTATNLVIASTALSTNSAGYLGLPVNEQDATYTFGLSDAGKLIRCNSASTVGYTVPLVASVNYPIGTAITVRNAGAGTLTLAPAAGATVAKAGSAPQASISLAQYALCTMIMEAANVWVFAGTGMT